MLASDLSCFLAFYVAEINLYFFKFIILFSNINEDKRKIEKQMLLFEVVKEIEDYPVS